MSLMQQGNYSGVLLAGQVNDPKSETGSPQLAWEFDLLDDSDPPVPTGVRRTVYMSLSKKALDAFVAAELDKHGFNWDFANPRLNDAYYESPGVELYCKHDPYNNQLKEKWQFSNGGGLGKPADQSTVARLQAEHRSRTQKVIAPGTKPTAPKPAPRPQATTAATGTTIPTFSDVNECYTHYLTIIPTITDEQAQQDHYLKSVAAVEKETGKCYDDFAQAEWARIIKVGELPF